MTKEVQTRRRDGGEALADHYAKMRQGAVLCSPAYLNGDSAARIIQRQHRLRRQEELPAARFAIAMNGEVIGIRTDERWTPVLISLKNGNWLKEWPGIDLTLVLEDDCHWTEVLPTYEILVRSFATQPTCPIHEGGFSRHYGPYGLEWRCKEWTKGCDIKASHSQFHPHLWRMSDLQTRQARMAAHQVFDLLWKKGPDRHFAKRTDAYFWLADVMGLSSADAHIQYLSAEGCAILKDKITELRRKIQK